MQVMAVTCPSCGAQVDLQPGQRMAQCQFCGAQVMVDDGVQRVEQRITYDNAEEAGYSFERGRQRAQREAGQMPMGAPQVRRPMQPAYQPQPQQKAGKGKLALWVLGWLIFFPIPLGILIARAVQKRQREEGRPVSSTGSIILWVLGWIFVFPVPLTILMLRKKDMPKAARIAVIAAGWLAYLLIIGIGMATSPKEATKSAKGDAAVTANTKTKEDKEESKPDEPAADAQPAEQQAPAEDAALTVDEQPVAETPVPVAPEATEPVVRETPQEMPQEAVAQQPGLEAGIPQEVAAPAAPVDDGLRTVYVTQSGTKYHYNRNCQHLCDSAAVWEMTRDEAVSQQWTEPCGTCSK